MGLTDDFFRHVIGYKRAVVYHSGGACCRSEGRIMGLTGGAVAIEKENKDMNWVALDSIDFVEGIHE